MCNGTLTGITSRVLTCFGFMTETGITLFTDVSKHLDFIRDFMKKRGISYNEELFSSVEEDDSFLESTSTTTGPTRTGIDRADPRALIDAWPSYCPPPWTFQTARRPSKSKIKIVFALILVYTT